MPAAFPNEDQRRSYDRHVGDPPEEQLACFFHLNDQDLRLVTVLRADHTRLVLQLAPVGFLGTSLAVSTNIPDAVVAFVGRRLGIEEAAGVLPRYLLRGPAQREHGAESLKLRAVPVLKFVRAVQVPQKRSSHRDDSRGGTYGQELVIALPRRPRSVP